MKINGYLKFFSRRFFAEQGRNAAACLNPLWLLCLLTVAACGTLGSSATPDAPNLYSLDSAKWTARVAKPTPSVTTLVVNMPTAAAGFDSRRIVYTQRDHALDYFANSEWIDTPARMLAPLLVTALENSGAFRAVVKAPGAASGDLRLVTEIVRLQQEFVDQPSRVRFVLRAHLLDETSRQIVATRDFDAVAPAPSDGPYGGVVAANQAVQEVLEKLAIFCAETAAQWRSGNTAMKPR